MADWMTDVKASFDEWIARQNEERKKKSKKGPSGTLFGGKQAKQLKKLEKDS